ncbi:MAG: alpha/beta hydrolase [Bacteroidota bacterium]
MKKFLFLFLAWGGIGCISQPAPSNLDSLKDEIFLWPDSAPGSESLEIQENVLVRDSSGGACHLNRIVEKVTRPSLQAFVPDHPNGMAILLCPGGGYRRMAYDKEGYALAQWFNEQGITAFVLKYRLPVDGHRQRQYVPLQDAQRAMRYLRAEAQTYRIDPRNIGVMGASAGGHLAASLSVHHGWRVYEPRDERDSLTARPDFTVLMYPVISFSDSLGLAHRGSRRNLLGPAASPARQDSFSLERQVSSQTPPAFLFHAQTDSTVLYQNSVVYAKALEKAGVPHLLKLYPDGEHGMSRCEAGSSAFAQWPADLLAWLADLN